MKPDVTFFGEPIKPSVKRAIETDRDKVDLILVIGTSLLVQPMSGLPGFLPDSIPRVLVNLTPVQGCAFDASLLGPCDEIMRYLASQLGYADIGSSVGAEPQGRDPAAGPRQEGPRVWRFGPSEEPAVQPAVSLPASDRAARKRKDAPPPPDIISCDQCQRETKSGFSCCDCFDYDLCRACYSRGRNHHVESTKHRFRPF